MKYIIGMLALIGAITLAVLLDYGLHSALGWPRGMGGFFSFIAVFVLAGLIYERGSFD